MKTEYSVLMSVYFKEKPDFLKKSMDSIFAQTVQTNDFVLVCDGPLTSELDEVIIDMKKRYPSLLNIVRLDENGGLGKALNEGIKHCKNELIARMDSDDILYPDRCKRQLEVFAKHPEIGVCSGVVEEFSERIEHVKARRIPPETQQDILKFVRKRNPFTHPCVMYRRSEVEKAGGYQDFYLLEDYYLWIRMLQNGTQGYNLQESLLWMRAGSEMYERRSGRKYAKAQRMLFKYMKDNGMNTTLEYVTSCIVRTISSIAPNNIRKVAFQSLMRKE